MGGQQPLGPEVEMRIRFGLDRLRARNGFHEFEGLCLAFANARLGGHFVPATGPVGAGGDHGRDFTSHLRMVQDRETTFVDEVVAICTTQVDRVVDKIRSDLRKVTADRPVKAVFAFLTADLPIGQVERLKHEAESDYGIRLEIFDGNRLAHSMAMADFASIAYRWLHLDPRSLSGAVRATDEARQWVMEVMPDSFRPDLHDYLEAVLEACRRHPWRFVDQVPDLRALYQPQSLEGPDGSPCGWQQAVERSQCLVISGPAGAGKSSLLQYVAASLADRWLKRQPQPWLPVLVRAHDLAEGKPLIQALRDGVERVLKSLLHRPLDVDFFDREPPTEQWLVLVDGLDEVRDRDQREEVLQAAEHAARRASMRFVITSRPGVWNTDTATFTHYTLRPLLDVDLRRFVTRWLERRGRASKTVELWALEMIRLLGRGGWQPTPLVVAMICVLADIDADQPGPTILDGIYSAFVDRLVTRLTRVDEPAIDSVQNQIHTLLEEAAAQRLFSDPDARLLDLVIASATTHGITPPAPLAADWHQTVEEVLLRSGLITKQGKELEFLHASFEEYYVARAFPNWTPAGIVGALADQEESFYTKTDLVLANLSLLEFLLARTDDVDAAVSAIIEEWPSAAQTVVEYFENYGLGERTADALTTIAADRHELLDVRESGDRARRAQPGRRSAVPARAEHRPGPRRRRPPGRHRRTGPTRW